MEEKIAQAIKFYLDNEADKVFKDEVEALVRANDETELNDRFYRTLEFGTAGLRGIIAGGTNRMNPLVVKRATQGMADYVRKAFPSEAERGDLRVVIAYDCRNYSREFAKAAALIFVANGFTCYLFSDLRTTPELSFAIRQLHCHTGVVITASHNPKQYNGYKAYWSDGAQITPPHDSGIIDAVNTVSTVKEISEAEALKTGRLKLIDKEIDEKFWAMVESKISRTDLIAAMSRNVKIAYTPLHGTGAMHVEKVLGDFGFHVLTVPEQREPDGNFPTASYPNPEEAAALQMGIDFANREGANILMATDPDSDRFACAVRNEKGEMQIITGNQMGVLFADYLALTAQEQNRLPKHGVMICSIVSSRMIDEVARSYGVRVLECLTGFKWICGEVEKIIRKGDETYMFGFEESYGYNFGEEVRDKDGISASAVCAEMTLYWQQKGLSLFQRLDQLFAKQGVFAEKTVSKTFEGESGLKTMQKMMQTLRQSNVCEIAGCLVEKIRDIKAQCEYSPATPEKTTPIDLPKSDVLQYFLEGGTVLCVRPSGTEPKIKTYILYRSSTRGDVAQEKEKAAVQVQALEKAIAEMMRS